MNTVEIIFSPTGGTEKVSHIISREWSRKIIILQCSLSVCCSADQNCQHSAE